MRWAQRSAEIFWCRSMLKFSCLSLAALLIWQGAAFAQTATAAKPTPSLSVSTSTTATKRSANTGEIFRWVDKNGKVHYSSDVPEDHKSTARKVDTRGNIVSSRVPASIAAAPAPAPAQDAVARQPITEREKCEAAWQEYRASQDCYAGFRRGLTTKPGSASGTGSGAGSGSGTGSGSAATGPKRARSGVSPEAESQCKSVTEPAPCR
jgi:Domain of unknown function (DUF4124)